MTNRPLPRRARALALTGAVALTLGLAACGGDDACVVGLGNTAQVDQARAVVDARQHGGLAQP